MREGEGVWCSFFLNKASESKCTERARGQQKGAGAAGGAAGPGRAVPDETPRSPEPPRSAGSSACLGRAPRCRPAAPLPRGADAIVKVEMRSEKSSSERFALGIFSPRSFSF